MITQKFSHSLNLQELSIQMLAESNYDDTKDSNRAELDFIAGYTYPMVQIKSIDIKPEELISLEIDSYGKIPKVTCIIRVIKTHDFVMNILKDREILKVFTRSNNPDKNHIRLDFFLTSIDQINKRDSVQFVLSGELNIPKLNASVNRGFAGTSLDVIKSIAQELKLGFSTNLTSTNDDMVWLATNQTYHQFIDYVVKHSWIDDQSFTDWYIDVYNNLVFYEVEDTLMYREIDTRFYRKFSSTKKHYDEAENKSFEWKNVLSDLPDFANTDHGFENLRVINNSKLSKSGYVNNNIILDYADLEIVEFISEAITNENRGVPLKSRPDDETYRDELRSKFLGIQNDNMHSNYMYAVIHNNINNLELDKLNIEVNVTDINLNYIIGDSIYLQVTEPRLPEMSNESMEARKSGVTYDQEQLTNDYQIHGIKHIYKNRAMYTKYLLSRKEWPLGE